MNNVDKLFEVDSIDRDDYFNEHDWTNEELQNILDRIDYGESSANNIIVHSIACHPQTNIEQLKTFALSGKYGAGCIKAVLLNGNCTEEIIRAVYNKSADDPIFSYVKKENIKKYGEDNWNDWKEGIINGINNLALDHKNCPGDFK